MTGNSGLTRRDFLKAAAVAAAGPYVLPSRAPGAPGRRSPNDQIGLALIGVGGRGAQHLRAYAANPDCRILAVCEVQKGRLQGSKDLVEELYGREMRSGVYRGCDAYGDFRQVLARPDVDAVVVSTNGHWHSVISVEAAKAGKDILSEKPLALTVGDCRAMVQAVRRYGRVFEHGTQWRTWPMMRRACELIRAGAIGEVKLCQVGGGHFAGPPVCLPGEPAPDDIDWDMWLGPLTWRPYNKHYLRHGGGREFGSGWMDEIGSHVMDLFTWMLDMELCVPEEVVRQPGPPGPDGKVADCLVLRFANGLVIRHSPGAHGTLVFHGSKARLEVFLRNPPLMTFPEDVMKQRVSASQLGLHIPLDHRQDFLDCIRSRRRCFCDVEIAYHSATTCHLAAIAWWLNRPVRWDCSAERIAGDEEANRWLDRPKRAPWHV